jgi:hypothetical protein
MKRTFRLSVFESRLLKKIIRLKNEEAKGSRRELHIGEFNLYASPIIIIKMKSKTKRWAKHVEGMSVKNNAYMLLVRMLGRMRPL